MRRPTLILVVGGRRTAPLPASRAVLCQIFECLPVSPPRVSSPLLFYLRTATFLVRINKWFIFYAFHNGSFLSNFYLFSSSCSSPESLLPRELNREPIFLVIGFCSVLSPPLPPPVARQELFTLKSKHFLIPRAQENIRRAKESTFSLPDGRFESDSDSNFYLTWLSILNLPSPQIIECGTDCSGQVIRGHHIK